MEEWGGGGGHEEGVVSTDCPLGGQPVRNEVKPYRYIVHLASSNSVHNSKD